MNNFSAISQRKDPGEFFYEYAVIGGDLRMKYAAEFLAGQGKTVITYGIVGDAKGCVCAESLRQSVKSAGVVIGPVPLSKEGNIIEHKSQCGDMTIDQLVDSLNSRHSFFAACLSADLQCKLTEKKVFYHDFMKDDITAIFNSIATAEGIIAEAIKEYPRNLHQSDILILGYGRCAKTLADKLKYLTLGVTVCARNESQLAQALVAGFKTITYEELPAKIKQYHLIFNSVPSLILNQQILDQMDLESMIFDIASSPGGVDFNYAHSLGINAKSYPGLPGKYSPKTSGEILISCVQRIIK